MSLLNTSAHHLLMEAAENDLGAFDNVFEDEIEASFEDMWAGLPDLEAPIQYNEEAVVICGTDANQSTAVVEYDNLAKFMESNNITDVAKALDRLKEYYNLNELGIVVDSYDEASEVMETVKVLGRKANNKVGLSKVQSSVQLLKDLKNKGVKVFKKKGTKKGKKKSK